MIRVCVCVDSASGLCSTPAEDFSHFKISVVFTTDTLHYPSWIIFFLVEEYM